jgi:hypothetical protein
MRKLLFAVAGVLALASATYGTFVVVSGPGGPETPVVKRDGLNKQGELTKHETPILGKQQGELSKQETPILGKADDLGPLFED